jgi:L-ascorbate metabolism protein UlaG (beta-lactamase superfamily)
MEIKRLGHSCFKIKTKDTTLIIDPYSPEATGLKFTKTSADVLLITHEHDDHNYREGVTVSKIEISNPGIYEANDILIYGYETYHDDQKGALRGKNTIYELHIEDYVILHLGDLGHELSRQTLEKVADVDVLMLPIGGVYTIDPKIASKVIGSIEPDVVIPMHYQVPELTLPETLKSVEDFLKEVGAEDTVTRDSKLKLNSRTSFDDSETTFVILE